ncbi:uncharacterized protein LOC128884390 isoform X2 [Hylaeus volcanicus]|uniref:uncharacterized protein LOC128884390 isoform X2 n=1 Tax=Hylaeus volcanicus TaxID=313075 RepID=UPI0023B7A4F6|nr:uncharacterized protein LOC128884390 isoform X2 [Hylaeus volcanicus]
MNYDTATSSFPASRGRGRAAILPAWMTDPVLAKEARSSLTKETSTEPFSSSYKDNLQETSQPNKTHYVDKTDSCLADQKSPNINVAIKEKYRSTSGSSEMRTASSYDSNLEKAPKPSSVPNSVPTTLTNFSKHATDDATRQLDVTIHKKNFNPPDRKNSKSSTSSRDRDLNHSKTSRTHSNTSQLVSSSYHENSCYCGKSSHKLQCDCTLKLRDHHYVKKKRSRSCLRDSDSHKLPTDTYKKSARQSLPPISDVHVADMLCEDLIQICNSQSFRKLTARLVQFRENVDTEIFVFEDINGHVGSWRSFEKYWLSDKRLHFSVEVTHRVSIAASKTTSYVLQLEWIIPLEFHDSHNKKSTSHFALYECREKKLTRCFQFQNSLKDYMKKEMSFTFRRLRQERAWHYVVKYILKKGYKPSINCVFWDFIENKNVAEPLVLN